MNDGCARAGIGGCGCGCGGRSDDSLDAALCRYYGSRARRGGGTGGGNFALISKRIPDGSRGDCGANTQPITEVQDYHGESSSGRCCRRQGCVNLVAQLAQP
eukprot:6769279-Pyramimonas_sp.AAC.1